MTSSSNDPYGQTVAMDEIGGKIEVELHSNEDVPGRNLHETNHPFEIQCVPRLSDRGTYSTRSMDHGIRRKRFERTTRNRSFDSQEIGVLMGSAEAGAPRIGGKASGDDDDNGDVIDIGDFLPSRLAATDGTRTFVLRRSRRSRGRGSSRRRAGEELEQEATDAASRPAARVEDGDAVDFAASELGPTDGWETKNDLNSIRLHATTMNRKREMRQELLEKITRENQKIINFKKLFIRANEMWKRQCDLASNVSHNFQFWNKSFKKIEGTFGPCVLSYFVFVRLLLFMDVFIMLTILATIIVPQTFVYSFDFVSENCQNVSNTSDIYVQKSCNFSLIYQNYILEVQRNSSAGQKVIDLFLGTGWIENSALFLGYYSSDVSAARGYDMALAYLLTTGFYLAVILIFMVVYTGQGLKDHMLRFRDQSVNPFDRVFCGWDFSLCNAASAQAKHETAYKEFERICIILKKRQEVKDSTFGDRCRLVARRLFGHCVVASLLFGAGATIAATIMVAIPSLRAETYVKNRDFLVLIVSFLPSIVLTVLNAILPVIFKSLSTLEKYSDETQLQMTLIRTVFLRLASIAVLFTTLIVQFNNCNDATCNTASSSPHITHCWETYMGQQLYRLVLLDFVMVLFVFVLYEFPLSVFSKRFPRCWFSGLREFNVPQNVIDITYTQALCWIGAFFCPLIPLITILKLLIFFLIKKNTLMGNYKPKPSRASGTTYFFMIILMISFVLCSSAAAYTIGRLPPSMSCGPFRVYSDERFYMFNALTVAIRALPPGAQRFLFVIGSWIFYLALVILFSFLIMWRCLKMDAHQELVSFLKERLKTEHADKQFLLRRVKAMGEVR